MLNVTIKFIVYCLFFSFFGCQAPQNRQPDLAILHYADSLSEARIDSAYAAIKANCDTLMKYKAPVMADSLLKDSGLLKIFFDTIPYTDPDEKVQKVVRQLEADCDSNLLKETYRIARQRQKEKPVQHKKAKVLPVVRRSTPYPAP
jgi:hypothetical protein